LSIKTADGMVLMKTDMSGSAIVMGALLTLAELGARVKVTALAPLAENMLGGSAMKPGDVLTIRTGQTIEVLNTDAEGRLVLADALAIASEQTPAPEAIVDVATLTGAATIALGTGIAMVFSNNDGVRDALLEASKISGERIWPMPLPDDYGSHIDSDVADMKNTGRAGQAGAIAAAQLLGRFVGSHPWAHLDIAGPARSGETQGLYAKGGTAFSLRLLVAYGLGVRGR
jgi:leucyl aminopeptidase